MKDNKLLHHFVDFASKHLKLDSLPNIYFHGHEEDTKNTFGHSIDNDIHIRSKDRHPVDVMRTIAHELVHYKQYLQTKKGEKMKEDDANATAGRIMRDYGTKHPNVFKSEVIDETESMGAANHTGGAIANYDPLLGLRKRDPLTNMLKRKAPRKLRDIIDHEKKQETKIH